jgi:hypothetical protein
MWDGMCEVVRDRECTHVRIQRRLTGQGRQDAGSLPPKDYSKKLKPGSLSVRESGTGEVRP